MVVINQTVESHLVTSSYHRSLLSLIPIIVLLASLAGCAKEAPKAAPLPPPTVGVSKPISREITDYADFTGRTSAPYTVDIRARVTGYITKMPYVEGTEVKTNDMLFEIDPRPYQAELDRAQGIVTHNKAKLKLAKADNIRAKSIAEMNAGAISKQDLDKYVAQEEEAAAEVDASIANLESYKINLEFTRVISPIDGQVSRYNLTIGNLVNADTTLLTTVVSQDPMYAYFDVDENTLLNVTRQMLATPSDPIQAKTFPVLMGLADEEGYPHVGALNFANNVVSSSTGTLTVRGTFPNPAAESGRRLLKPGMFVRIRLPLGKPREALLVNERALGSDQGRKYLLIVGEDKKVEYRRVTVGPLQDDGLRVIESGLKPTDTVIISGLQLVRPKMEVVTEEESMERKDSPPDVEKPAAHVKQATPESSKK